MLINEIFGSRPEQKNTKLAKKLIAGLYDPGAIDVVADYLYNKVNNGVATVGDWRTLKHMIVGSFGVFKHIQTSEVQAQIKEVDQLFDMWGLLLGDANEHQRKLRETSDAIIEEISNLIQLLPDKVMDENGKTPTSEVMEIYAEQFAPKEYNNSKLGLLIKDYFKNTYASTSNTLDMFNGTWGNVR